MKRAALFVWDAVILRDRVGHIDALAGLARKNGCALHVYVLSDKSAAINNYQHASAEVVAPGILHGWRVMRLLQRLVQTYDIAFFYDIPPESLFLCRSASTQMWFWRGGWVYASIFFTLRSFFLVDGRAERGEVTEALASCLSHCELKIDA